MSSFSFAFQSSPVSANQIILLVIRSFLCPGRAGANEGDAIKEGMGAELGTVQGDQRPGERGERGNSGPETDKIKYRQSRLDEGQVQHGNNPFDTEH